jgi:hypothetical protein
MIKKILLFTLIFTITLYSKAQEIRLCFQSGYGYYNMKSLSDITEGIFYKLPFQSKIIANYPSFYYFQPMVKLCFTHFNIGITWSYQSTGSRISSKDYSGEYRFDSRIYSRSPGIIVNGILFRSHNFGTGLLLQLGKNFTTLKMSEFIEIDTTKTSNDYNFSTVSYYYEPGFNIFYTLKSFNFEISVGYYKEFKRKDFQQIGTIQNKIGLKKSNNDMWDGFRLGATLSFTIFKIKYRKNGT